MIANSRSLQSGFVLMLIACSKLGAGSFSVNFTWAGKPPDLSSSTVYVRARVENAAGVILGEAGPDQFKPGLSLAFSNVPNGDGRVVTVQLLDAPGLAAQVLYYGVSKPFSIGNGEQVEVEVALQLRPAPGIDSGTASIAVANKVTGSRIVELILTTDTGVSVRLANTPDPKVAEQLGAPSSTSGGLSTYVRANWDLDQGLPAPCDSVCPRTVYASFIDANGVASPTASVDLTLDLQPPAVVKESVTLRILAGADNPLRADPAALSRSSTALISFTLDKILASNPKVSLAGPDPAGLQVQLSAAAAASFVYQIQVAPGAAPDGRYLIRIDGRDLAGNAISTALDTILAVDTRTPDAPAVNIADQVVYNRNPWGSAATHGTPAFSVHGNAGAAPAEAVAVIAYDGPDIATASELGRVSISQAGAPFDLPLARADHARVFVASVDAAGNLSAAVPVHDISWTATLAGKTPGNTLTNPHGLITSQSFILRKTAVPGLSVGSRVQDPAYVSEPLDSSGLTLPGDGNALAATAFPFLWQPLAPATGALARHGGTAVADTARGRMVFFSGTRDEEGIVDVIWESDGTSWTSSSPLIRPSGFDSQSPMAYDARHGQTVLFAAVTGATWLWDGHAWTQAAPATSLSLHQAYALAYDASRGRTVFLGQRHTAEVQFDTWEWDGADWTDLTPANNPPAGPIVYDGARILLVAGDTWAWDGSNWTKLLLTTSTPPSIAAMAFDPVRRRVVAFTGSETWEWDGAGWSLMTPLATPPHALSAMAFDGNRGKMVLLDTSFGSTVTPVWEWDGGDWTEITPAPGPGATGSMAYDSARGQAVVVDGNDSSDTWVLGDGAWSNPFPIVDVPGPGLLSYDSIRQRTVLFGTRLFPPPAQQQTWEWNGSIWENLTPQSASPPTIAGSPAMAFDSKRGRTLLVAPGASGFGSSTTWAWDGSSWSDITPAPPLPPVTGALAYDALRDRAVLFPGNFVIQQTWEWDGTNWSQASPSVSPPPRVITAMAFDRVRGRTVLFGGLTRGKLFGDTWEWDGVNWTNVTLPVSPSPRANHSMAYDSAHGRVLLFGSDTTTDTWAAVSDPNRRVAQLAHFSFAAAGAVSPLLRQISFTAHAGGTGSTSALLGPGVSIPGASMAVWDAFSGAWQTLATNPSSAAGPTAMTYATRSPAEAQRYLADALGSPAFDVALFPNQGNGVTPAQLSVDYLELTVTYSE